MILGSRETVKLMLVDDSFQNIGVLGSMKAYRFRSAILGFKGRDVRLWRDSYAYVHTAPSGGLNLLKMRGRTKNEPV